MSLFKKFNQLHQNTTPLLLGNFWDVNSAKLFESCGYHAIGTSSHSVAETFGYDDGEKMPFEDLLQLAKRAVQVVKIPVTIDLEGGFSRSVNGIIENIEKLHDVGVVGINLEDTVVDTTRAFQPASDFQKVLSIISNHIVQKKLNVFLNVRTDAFLLGMKTALDETLTRIKAYEVSGADGIFVPCITDREDIRKVVGSTHLPINVMCMPLLPDFKTLESLGVKRISIGPFAKNYANKKTEEILKLILKEETFDHLL